MTPEQFAYWLQGFVELNGGKEPTAAQWKSITDHLAEVFTKVTPPVETPAVPAPVRLDEKDLEKQIRDLQKPYEHPPFYWPDRTAIC